MADEIKTRVTVESADAVRNLEQVTAAEQRMGAATRDVGDESRAASGALGAMARSVEGLVGTMGAASVATAFLGLLNSINEAAIKASESVAKLSRETGGLSANIGGNLSGQAVSQLMGISAESGFSPEDNKKLVEFMSAMTDMREIEDAGTIQALGERGALLQKATGGGISGAQGAELLQSAVARLGIDDDQAVNLLSTLGNSGFDAGTIATLINKGADKDMLALMLASRGSGLSKNDIGRKMDSLVSSLTAMGEDGGVAPELAALGITDGMSPSARLSHLVSGLDAGTIGKGEFVKATGGYTSQALVASLAPSIRAGGVGAAQAELMDPNAARSAVARRMSSPFAQAEVVENLKRLDEEAQRIELGRTAYAQALADVDGLDDISFLGIPTLLKTVVGLTASDDKIQSGLGQRVVNVKGRMGLLDDSGAPKPLVASSRPNRWINDPLGTANSTITNITNYINSTIHGKPPAEQPAKRKEQE